MTTTTTTTKPPVVHDASANGAPARNVTEALSRVMAELPGIGKDERADPRQGGYAYRGIEAITRCVQPLLARHGVVFAPHVHAHEVIDIEVNGKPWTDTRLLVSYSVFGPGGPEDRIEVGPILAIGRDNADKGANKCMTQAFKYLLLQLLCVSDSKDDADAASVEADRRRPVDDLDQRPAWERDGYPDEDTARETIERVDELLRSVETERRGPIRRWLAAHGYPPAVPVPVRADDATDLEAVIRGALSTEHADARWMMTS
jgi:hypothetical protein